jgi:hypothetical protein
MSFGSPRNHWDNASRSQFRAFFNRPLHAIELENREHNRYLNCNRSRNKFAEFKFNSVVGNGHNASAAYFVSRGDIEFLADAGSKYAG